jgi:hypothetical protein
MLDKGKVGIVNLGEAKNQRGKGQQRKNRKESKIGKSGEQKGRIKGREGGGRKDATEIKTKGKKQSQFSNTEGANNWQAPTKYDICTATNTHDYEACYSILPVYFLSFIFFTTPHILLFFFLGHGVLKPVPGPKKKRRAHLFPPFPQKSENIKGTPTNGPKKLHFL